MTDYVRSTNFTAKDSLPSGNASKLVKGSEIDTELDLIVTAIASKMNSGGASLPNPTISGTMAGSFAISGTITGTGTIDGGSY